MSLQAKESKKNSTKHIPLGIYVHVPFCPTVCDFCSFYQEQPDKKRIESFLDTLKEEFFRTYLGEPVETVFWGGGTPGLLLPRDMEYLGAFLLDKMPSAPLEWSVEMAPSTVTLERLKTLKDLGVTRISLGVQSFNEDLLKALGRHQALSRTFQAWECIRKVGFQSTNLDLIFAVPGQTFAQWEADVNQAVALGPDHISTYCLTFEEDTPLYLKLMKGQVARNADQEARFYLKTWDLLESKGYFQYEVSNFARPGHACLHNVNTWKMFNWMGIGPSAASQYGGRRYRNFADLNRWQKSVFDIPIPREQEELLTGTLKVVDTLVFGLRMNEGVSYSLLQKEFPGLCWERLLQCLEILKANGLLKEKDQGICLTRKGLLLADAIGREIMGALEDA